MVERREVPAFLQKKTFNQHERQVVRVDTKDLVSMFRSKEDIYKYFTEQKQCFLPSRRGCSTHFLKQIMSDEKKVFKVFEIKFFQVPFFEEISVKSLYPKLCNAEKFQKYMPDFEQGQLPERDFFFGVVGTLYEDWLRTVIDEALKNRNTRIHDEEKGEYIVVTTEFFKELQSSQYLSKKPGKGLFLLQDKVVKRKMFKPKKQYSLAVDNPESLFQQTDKRRQINSTSSQSSSMFSSVEHAQLNTQPDQIMEQRQA